MYCTQHIVLCLFFDTFHDWLIYFSSATAIINFTQLDLDNLDTTNHLRKIYNILYYISTLMLRFCLCKT